MLLCDFVTVRFVRNSWMAVVEMSFKISVPMQDFP
jgi:hypothetical protein